MTRAHCIIIFPFPGMEWESSSHRFLRGLVDQCRRSSGEDPIVVHDRRSRRPESTCRILDELKANSVTVVETWGVDTCQDWLAGWGHVLDSRLDGDESNHRIVLLPGDLVHVVNEADLFSTIGDFITFDNSPFLIGDFESESPYSTKELIDSYGVFLLVANWFPEAWQAIQGLQIRRPRSEFINISVPELRGLLKSRAFAYEQTLNMLILKWYACCQRAAGNRSKAERFWNKEVARMYLGKIADDPSDRHYRGAIDQIERTERMLRMLWREVMGWNPDLEPEHFRKLIEEYERLDNRSTRIRDTSRIAIWAQLHRE